MATYTLPYGKTQLSFTLPDEVHVEQIAPPQVAAAPDPAAVVEAALDAPLGGVSLADFAGVRSAAIAINDKTRPVPHSDLLPPLLARLEALGLPPTAITLVIAAGTHPPMPRDDFGSVLPAALLERYPVVCHDCDDVASLMHLGETERGTPVWVNRRFAEAELRIVIGNIEPHQFQGFSGGVKSAAIGLAGRDTVNTNHVMMLDPNSNLGVYENNPARQDVEEIGQRIGIHFALNAILNEKKKIVQAIAGEPRAVMDAGIPLSRQVCQVEVPGRYDLIIASPGGYPKDLNVYQAQKGLAHACLVAKPGATVILAASCPEGSGSRGYEKWMDGATSYDQIFARFKNEGFRVGPHKAFQIARDAAKVNLRWLSDMPLDFAEFLLLNPITDLQAAVDEAVAKLPAGARVGIMPRASSSIPYLRAQEPVGA